MTASARSNVRIKWLYHIPNNKVRQKLVELEQLSEEDLIELLQHDKLEITNDAYKNRVTTVNFPMDIN